MRKTDNQRGGGFTLIEVLIVVIILGIAAAIIIPEISSRDDLKASASARVVMSDLMYAQNRAITTQKMIYVQFDTAAKNYALLSSLSPKTYVIHPISKENFQETFGSGGSAGLDQATLVASNFDGKSILAFDDLGSPYAVTAGGTSTALNVGTIQIKSGNSRTLKITVEPYTGELTVAELP